MQEQMKSNGRGINVVSFLAVSLFIPVLNLRAKSTYFIVRPMTLSAFHSLDTFPWHYYTTANQAALFKGVILTIYGITMITNLVFHLPNV